MGEACHDDELFRRTPNGPCMHLNQTLTECWFDDTSTHLVTLTVTQRDQLDKLMDEFSDVVGDEFHHDKQPDSVSHVCLSHLNQSITTDSCDV